MQRVLHEEEGGAHVDGEHLVEMLGTGIPNAAAISHPGGVHQGIDPAELLAAGGDDLAGVIDLRKIGFDEDRLHAFVFEVGFHTGTVFGVAAGDHHALHAPVGEELGDGLAQSLCRTGDDGDLAVHRQFGKRLDIHQATLTGLPVFQDSVAASASFWACRPSKPLGRAETPLDMPSIKVSTSLA